MYWIDWANDRDRWRALVNTVMNLRIPQNAGSFLTSCEAVSFSSRTLFHGDSYLISQLRMREIYLIDLAIRSTPKIKIKNFVHISGCNCQHRKMLI